MVQFNALIPKVNLHLLLYPHHMKSVKYCATKQYVGRLVTPHRNRKVRLVSTVVWSTMFTFQFRGCRRAATTDGRWELLTEWMTEPTIRDRNTFQIIISRRASAMFLLTGKHKKQPNTHPILENGILIYMFLGFCCLCWLLVVGWLVSWSGRLLAASSWQGQKTLLFIAVLLLAWKEPKKGISETYQQ